MSSVLLAGGELSGYHTSEAVDLCIQTTPDEHDFLWAHQGYELEETRTCTQPWLVVMVGQWMKIMDIDVRIASDPDRNQFFLVHQTG